MLFAVGASVARVGARDALAQRARARNRVLFVLAGAVLLLAILPAAAFAWTPGTHIFLGEAILRSLATLPAGIADVLRACWKLERDFIRSSPVARISISTAPFSG